MTLFLSDAAPFSGRRVAQAGHPRVGRRREVRADARDGVGASAPALPAMPVLILLGGMPVWWVLGLTPFLPFAMVAVLGGLLLASPRVQLLPGALPLLALLGWSLACATMVDAPLRLVGFGMRWFALAGAAVLLVYVSNSAITDRALLGALAVLAALVLVGGYLALAFPFGGFTTPIARILPGAVLGNELVHDLVVPQFAEVQRPWGADEPFARPAAPFPYTNGWGCAVALLTPSLLALRALSTRRLVRLAVPAGLLAAVPPALVTRNRGMLLVLGVVCATYLVGLTRRGDLRRAARVSTVFVVAALAYVTAGGWELIAARQSVSDTTAGRASVYAATAERVADSPVLGFGTPRAFDEIGIALGTQGAFWTYAFSYGVVGLALFLLFLGGTIARTAHIARDARGDDGLWLHSALVAAFVAGFFYGFDGVHLIVIVVPAAILLRRAAQRGP